MIYLIYLSGPHKGRTRNVTHADPETVLYKVIDYGWWWEIDYSDATEEETENWFPVDLGFRIGRASASGRPIYFMGRIYVAQEPSKIFEVAQRVIDEINWSACEISIDIDDGCGLFISVQSLN